MQRSARARRYAEISTFAQTRKHRASTEQALPTCSNCVNATEWPAIGLVINIDHPLGHHIE